MQLNEKEDFETTELRPLATIIATLLFRLAGRTQAAVTEAPDDSAATDIELTMLFLASTRARLQPLLSYPAAEDLALRVRDVLTAGMLSPAPGCPQPPNTTDTSSPLSGP